MKKTVCLLSIALLGLVSGCGPTDSELTRLARTSVQKQLKDPDSAKFGEITLVTPAQQSTTYQSIKVACGSVNAKNSYGGYEGVVRFTVFLGVPNGASKHEVVDVRIEPKPNDDIFKSAVWDFDCDGVKT